jgi:hypothetical protein
MLCFAKQYRNLVILPTKPLFFTIELYKRKSMDSLSFSEQKRKCQNKGENKVITVHQGAFLSLFESFSMVYILHEHLSQLGTYVICSVKVDGGHISVSIFNKSLFGVVESLWWYRTPMNTSVKRFSHMLGGIKVWTHCWSFHFMNVQISSGDARYIIVHEYEFLVNTVFSNQHML